MTDHTFLSVRNVLASYFEVHAGHIKPDQNLRRDWGVDPAELNMIAMRIEEQEDVEIRVQELESVDTVGQLTALVRAIRRRNELADEVTQVRQRRGPSGQPRERRVASGSSEH